VKFGPKRHKSSGEELKNLGLAAGVLFLPRQMPHGGNCVAII
jgi:hypothetical protein